MLSFSTSEIRNNSRLEYWHDVVCKHCVSADSNFVKTEPFNGQFQARRLGDIELCRMSSSAHVWNRRHNHLKRDSESDFMLGLMESGQGALQQAGRSSGVRPGQFVLYDSASPFTFALEHQTLMIVKIPRNRLLARSQQADRLTARVIGTTSPAAHLLRTMLTEIINMEDADNDENYQVEKIGDILVDMVGATLTGNFADDAYSRRSQSWLYEQACNYILSHLDNPDLSINQVADKLCVSERTLTRAFTHKGETPMRWVWTQRLARCHESLQIDSRQSITQLALRHGFASVAHFSRSFKKAYGVSPAKLDRPRHP